MWRIFALLLVSFSWKYTTSSLPESLIFEKYVSSTIKDEKQRVSALLRWCTAMAKHYSIIPGRSLGTLPKSLHGYYMSQKCYQFNAEATKQQPLEPPQPPNFDQLDLMVPSTLHQDVEFIHACKMQAGYYKDNRPSTSRILFMVGVNYAYRDFLMNFRCFTDNLELKFLPISFDKKIYSFITRKNIFPVTYQIPDVVNTTSSSFGSKNFNNIGCRKMEIVYAALMLNYDVIFSDVDIVLLKDPYSLLFHPNVDYSHSENVVCGDKWKFNDEMEGNTGFYAVRSNPGTKLIWNYAYQACRAEKMKYDDQSMFWVVVRNMEDTAPKVIPMKQCPEMNNSLSSRSLEKYDRRSASSNFITCPLNNCAFSAGALKDLVMGGSKTNSFRSYITNLKEYNIEPIMIHANWIGGSTRKRNALKQKGLWVTKRIKGNANPADDGDKGDSYGERQSVKSAGNTTSKREDHQKSLWKCGTIPRRPFL
jgi:hypothetical protein